MTAAIVGSLIVWATLSPTAALLLGRVIRLRDKQIPS
jgi:hypothetical protein